jgi:hypothetical protein
MPTQVPVQAKADKMTLEGEREGCPFSSAEERILSWTLETVLEMLFLGLIPFRDIGKDTLPLRDNFGPQNTSSGPDNV